jgi:two-component system, NarL family, nitrate/nitrite response regulator NarL
MGTHRFCRHESSSSKIKAPYCYDYVPVNAGTWSLRGFIPEFCPLPDRQNDYSLLTFAEFSRKEGNKMAEQVTPFIANQALRASHPSGQPAPTVTTVLLCDNSLLRSGLQSILRRGPFAPAVTASTANATQVQDVASGSALVLIEASQSISHLLDVIRRVKEQSPNARIVALADRFDLDFVRLGHQAGVDGFCSAASAPEVLIKSLELVMLGEPVIPSGVLRSVTDGAFECLKPPPHEHGSGEPNSPDLMGCKLSTRETQILNCLRQGAPNKAIARRLDVAEATVKIHMKAILRKIGVANRTQAAMWASQHLPQQVRASVNV